MIRRSIALGTTSLALLALNIPPAQAYGTPPAWLTGNATFFQEWTVTTISADMTQILDDSTAQSLSGDEWGNEFATFDVDYSDAGNFAYAIGDADENYYKIDLDNNTLTQLDQDLGPDGDNAIDLMAIDGGVTYVTYTNPATDMLAIGTINTTTYDIDHVVDLYHWDTPAALGAFDGQLYLISYESVSALFSLYEINLSTGVLTSLKQFDSDVDAIADGDIDNNGNFRWIYTDSDANTRISGYNVLTGQDLAYGATSGSVEINPIAYWGTPGETIAGHSTTTTNDDATLASTGVDASAMSAAGAAALVSIAAAGLLIARRRKA